MKETRVFIPNRIYFRIGDVAEILGVKPYVIRFWESEFPFVAPEKSTSGQRVYRRPQIEGLILIKHLLYVERYSIEGAKKKLTELRKSAKLKEAMLSLIRATPPDASEMAAETAGAENPAQNSLAQMNPSIDIGSIVPKEQISSLQEKVADLQNLIREPSVHGHKVPGLKEVKTGEEEKNASHSADQKK